MEPPIIKILVVDPSYAIFESAKMLLTKEEYKLSHARSASEGLKILEKEQFDLIFSELSMPTMDGLSFLKIVKEKYSKIPFVFITIDVHKFNHIKLEEIGAFGYIDLHNITTNINVMLEAFKKYKGLI